MRFTFIIPLFLLSTLLYAQKSTSPIGFIENKGQIVDQKGKENKQVHYLLNTPGLNVQLRNHGFSYDVYETKKVPLSKKDKSLTALPTPFTKEQTTPDYTLEYTYHRIDIDFENSNPGVQLVAEGKSADYDNYYNVVHAPEGITAVHKYQKVTYQNIYNQIDVVFFIPKDSTKSVEYNFIVKPGGKVSDIQMKFNGVKTELVDNKIKMNVRFGQMEETLPLSWIEQGSSKKEIAVNYVNIKKNVYGFAGDVNTSDKTIVIDPVPVRLWGTFYGNETTGGNPYFGDICTDTMGNIYFSGYTASSISSYATSGAHQSNTLGVGSVDGIIAKFDSNGNRLWGTFYGGGNTDQLFGIKVDSQNNIIITGTTYSNTNISTNNAITGFQDAFIAKFTPTGSRIWGTYFGGEHDEISYDVDIDFNNNIYITGTTRSYGGIAINSNFQTLLNQVGSISNSSFDGFVSKFDSNGNLIWGTYAGGDMSDELRVIKVTSTHILVGGETMSSNISSPGAHQENSNGLFNLEGMVYKFTLSGTRLWSTFYGGESFEKIKAIEVDDDDNIYIGGVTRSTNSIATTGSFDDYNLNWESGFLVKLNPDGQRLWGTYIGQGAQLYSIKFKNGSIYVGGTGGNDLSIVSSCAYQRSGFAEGYLGKFSKNGNFLLGTYVGGFDQYSETKFCFDQSNNIIVGGTTHQNDGIAGPGSYQSTILGPKNFYLIKFSETNNCDININPTSNSPVCIGGTIELYSPPGYQYSWTGPNGFTSTIQNPIINNATPANSGLYTLIISDGIICSCQKTYTFNIVVEDNLKPIPDIVNLPIINGDCHTAVTTIPTATDNCTGLINGTTTNPLSYSNPGTYTIVWSYNDGNGNTATQNQTVIVTAVASPIVATNYYFCPNQTPSLSDITITGQNIQWYDAQSGGNLLPSTTLLQNGMTYYASQTINGCESDRILVTINIQNTSAPTGNLNQSFCSSQNATLNNIAISGTNINWYNSLTGNTILSSNTLLTDNTTYYATQTVNNCESLIRLAVTVTLINTLNANDYSETICDDLNNSTETINLSNYNSNLIATTSSNTFTYYHSQNGAENQIGSDEINNFSNYNLSIGNNIVFVRIDSTNSCHQVVMLNLNLVSKPIITITDIMPICEGSSITVNPGTGFDSYLWSTSETSQSINISTPGNYSVTVTKNHGGVSCTSVKNFTVTNSNAAIIQEIITSDWTSNQNTMSVLLTTNSNGDYVYSIDGINYQTSNTFSDLTNGEYTVFVKDNNGCGITSQEVYLLMYPHFFTPNEDGYNDTWKIEFSEIEPNLTIKIFNRFGKLLKELDSNSKGWNGTYLGQPLPSDDYWFVVKRNNGKEFRAHFALKR